MKHTWTILSGLVVVGQVSAQNGHGSHDICQTDAQCLNGGRCEQVNGIKGPDINFNHCLCSDGFGGQRCEVYCPLQCQNGGICFTKEDDEKSNPKKSYACKCLGHWSGNLCDVPYENCPGGGGVSCYNGGSCSANGCDCLPGYGGPTCLEIVSSSKQDEAAARVRLGDWELTKKQTSILILTLLCAITILMYTMYACKRRRHLRYATVNTHEEYELEISNRKTSTEINRDRFLNII